jgi:hypothetical protein
MAGARDGALLRRSLEIGVYLPFSASNSANSSSIASEALMTVAGVAVSLCSLQKMDAPRATHHSVSGRALGPIGKEAEKVARCLTWSAVRSGASLAASHSTGWSGRSSNLMHTQHSGLVEQRRGGGACNKRGMARGTGTDSRMQAGVSRGARGKRKGRLDEATSCGYDGGRAVHLRGISTQYVA